jgi:DNA adenine methylase
MKNNPVLKYYGAKFRLAKWIIEHFPAHSSYVEPFGGGGAVLFQKPASALETYNDLDNDVCNFFRILRARTGALIKQIQLTPWSRNEYERCLDNSPAGNLENARRLFVRLWMSMMSGTVNTAGEWRRFLDGKKGSPAQSFHRNTLYHAAERLKLVQLENRDALKLIKEFDRPGALFYVDPPYVHSTRTTKKGYAFEMTDEQHEELAETLHGVKAHVVLSGYACELYRKLYEKYSWIRVDKAAKTNGGTKTESLWLSPETFAALKNPLAKNHILV